MWLMSNPVRSLVVPHPQPYASVLCGGAAILAAHGPEVSTVGERGRVRGTRRAAFRAATQVLYTSQTVSCFTTVPARRLRPEPDVLIASYVSVGLRVPVTRCFAAAPGRIRSSQYIGSLHNSLSPHRSADTLRIQPEGQQSFALDA